MNSRIDPERLARLRAHIFALAGIAITSVASAQTPPPTNRPMPPVSHPAPTPTVNPPMPPPSVNPPPTMRQPHISPPAHPPTPPTPPRHPRRRAPRPPQSAPPRPITPPGNG